MTSHATTARNLTVSATATPAALTGGAVGGDVVSGLWRAVVVVAGVVLGL